MNISYTKQGDYLIPNLRLKEKDNKNIGRYGILVLEYIKNSKKGLYQQLLMRDKLTDYICYMDKYLRDLEWKLMEELAEKEKIDEQLKGNDQIKWVKAMNNIKLRVQEIITREYIYV